MSHFCLRPNDTALLITNGGERAELNRDVAAAMIEVGDTFTEPGRYGIFQMRSKGMEVPVGKNAQGVRPVMRFPREYLEV